MYFSVPPFIRQHLPWLAIPFTVLSSVLFVLYSIYEEPLKKNARDEIESTGKTAISFLLSGDSSDITIKYLFLMVMFAVVIAICYWWKFTREKKKCLNLKQEISRLSVFIPQWGKQPIVTNKDALEMALSRIVKQFRQEYFVRARLLAQINEDWVKPLTDYVGHDCGLPPSDIVPRRRGVLWGAETNDGHCVIKTEPHNRVRILKNSQFSTDEIAKIPPCRNGWFCRTFPYPQNPDVRLYLFLDACSAKAFPENKGHTIIRSTDVEEELTSFISNIDKFISVSGEVQ